MIKPKATVLEIEKFNQEPEDKYYAKIKFKDPDTGEQLIGEFKLWSWNKPPAKFKSTNEWHTKCFPVQFKIKPPSSEDSNQGIDQQSMFNC